MAFLVPDHLPRKNVPQDVSTRILSAISETTQKGLTAQVASSWVAQLDDTIYLTKKRIHDRIHEDLPLFGRQLESTKSVQERLRSLTANVDDLSHSLSDPESGLIPRLLQDLASHASVAQEATNTSVKLETLEHLALCRKEYTNFTFSLGEGKLPEAKSSCLNLQKLVMEAPPPLTQAKVFKDLSREFQALKARTDEQLDDAYTRSVVISATEIIIRPSVQVRRSETFINLPSIFSCLSPEAMGAHISTMRRDISTHFIDYLSKQPCAVSVSENEDIPGSTKYHLTIFPSPPDSENRSSRLANLSTVLTFLSTHLFTAIPEPHVNSLRQSLCKPLTNAVLQNLLIPSLPASLDRLPWFLRLAEQALKFEEEYISNVLGDKSPDKEIQAWVKGISGHYERKRRIEILDRARAIIVQEDDPSRTFRAEVDTKPEITTVPVEAVQDDVADDSAWGFEDEKEINGDAIDENGWGLDDDEPAPELKENKDEGPAEAWGWKDDDEATAVEDNTEEVEDDNPWEDDPWNDPPQESLQTLPPPLPVSPIPKPATRLEKLSAKAKNGRSSIDSPAASPLPPSIPASPAPPPPVPPVKKPSKQLEPIKVRTVSKESYLVSNRVKDVLDIVRSVVQESKEYTASKIFSPASTSHPRGTVLMQTASLVLDLYRALYPVKFLPELDESASRSMRFSNDCLYLGVELEKAAFGTASVKEKISECQSRLKVLGDSWFYYSIEKEERAINDILSRTEGLVDVADQEQFDECENAANEALQHIRRLAQLWKPILQKSKYYSAVGLVAEAALSRMLGDILALSDIPELDSHRLSELCRIFNALEGLFVEDPEQPSMVVAYVPSWLKFSYLSELLEASIADITYLFEEGALVDFEIDELIKLVRALFADTPLRTNTINKLMKGHPAPR
ncbi:hypothetical protein GLOTRDRAFT_115586 [Gloeophyllum trabeum ATCC 11539]|uniref:ZW10 C-terminal helical domain-containing protein n=1 Tax=Gloeophyllum trabeum (strain ATCC 11539 / FP-39264 / Madison 617) TaxID=670483 RepID=S7Q9R3_GLOTA|nr:uncharacterized protein GLOTRDRAFT_115586 [Gloeophyllum trabeum ATCC 11539]EPQ56262.1 hypothetical protein GLOTRDRAFT_115586 [Gloeophyllum trabeum ATCC 11539]